MRAGLSFSMCAKRRAGIPVSRSPRRLIGKMYLYSNPPVTLSAWRHLWGRQWHSFRSGPAGPASAAHRYRYRSAAQFSCVPYLPPPTPEREREKERERERERGRERTREMTKPLKLCSSAAPPLQKHSESQREVPSRGWRQGHFVPSASDTRRASALWTKATRRERSPVPSCRHGGVWEWVTCSLQSCGVGIFTNHSHHTDPFRLAGTESSGSLHLQECLQGYDAGICSNQWQPQSPTKLLENWRFLSSSVAASKSSFPGSPATRRCSYMRGLRRACPTWQRCFRHR